MTTQKRKNIQKPFVIDIYFVPLQPNSEFYVFDYDT